MWLWSAGAVWWCSNVTLIGLLIWVCDIASRHGQLRAVQLTSTFSGGYVYCAHLFAFNLSAAGPRVRGEARHLASHLSHGTQTLCPICQTGVQAGTSTWQRLDWDTAPPSFPLSLPLCHYIFVPLRNYFTFFSDVPPGWWGHMPAQWRKLRVFIYFHLCWTLAVLFLRYCSLLNNVRVLYHVVHRCGPAFHRTWGKNIRDEETWKAITKIKCCV